MKVELNIIHLTVLHGEDTDRLFIQFDGPAPFPGWLPSYKPILTIDVAKGTAEEYSMLAFGIIPENL